MRSRVLVGILLIGFLQFHSVAIDANDVQGSPNGANANERVTYVTTENFQSEVLESNLPVLVDFTATWCAHCKTVDPIIESLLPQLSGTAKVFKLDIDESPEIYSEFQLTGVPTVLFFNNGREEHRITGPQSREVYVKYLEGMHRGTPALEIKIALLGEDSFRRDFIPNRRPEVLREALEHYPNLLKDKFENGQSPLSLVLNYRDGGLEEHIELLLAENPKLSLGDHVGIGQCEEFERIVSQDPAAVNRTDPDGNSPLLTALIHHGRLKEKSCLRAVLDAGADPGMTDSSAFTVGRAAVIPSNWKFLEELLEKGLDTKHTDVDGRNALHWAAFYGFPPTVKPLLDHGVDPTIRALNGETAADIVRQKRDLWQTTIEGKTSVSEGLRSMLAMYDDLLAMLEGPSENEE